MPNASDDRIYCAKAAERLSLKSSRLSKMQQLGLIADRTSCDTEAWAKQFKLLLSSLVLMGIVRVRSAG